MKVIDLLNKIANGEEVPRKIKYHGYEWEYSFTENNYIRKCEIVVYRLTLSLDELNDEVEIIDEAEIIKENKIPEPIHWHEENGVGNTDDAFYVDVNDKSQYVDSEYDSWEMTVILKINEIIDYLESKEKEHK